ncbi:hypothetical protein CD928_17435 [Sphingopyxis sp. GW247-27LB]|nr:hypothetical protein CD928_17435 [Sphingopyxis sp. GW247-27LB]
MSSVIASLSSTPISAAMTSRGFPFAIALASASPTVRATRASIPASAAGSVAGFGASKENAS